MFNMVYPPLSAQIGLSPQATNTPNYGIYGSAPTPAPGTAFPCGTPTYANLYSYPLLTQGDGTPDPVASFIQALPLNGLKNFNFYYTANGTGFLSGGSYLITYTNSSQINCYGSGDIVTSYRPNTTHTNGVQVRPFNSPTSTPRGIHGVFKVLVPGGGGTVVPIQNEFVTINRFGTLIKVKTNGVGYYSFYYTNEKVAQFVPNVNNWVLTFSTYYNNCFFSWTEPAVIWFPDANPNSSGYYVTDSEWDEGTIILTSSAQGCTP